MAPAKLQVWNFHNLLKKAPPVKDQMFKAEDETHLVEDISHINQNTLHWTSYYDHLQPFP